MDERDAQNSLRDLGQRLDKARRAREQVAPGASRQGGTGVPQGALGLGLRIGVELVAAVAVALAIGWAFDSWLGTRPWGMVVGFFLGVAAGMLNVWRAVTGMGMAVGYRHGTKPAPPEQKSADWSDDED